MKKIISFILIISLLLLNCYANDVQSNADTLFGLGLFKGSDNGFELDRQATRAEATVMFIRLLGKENEALSNTYKNTFTDVEEWAQPYVSYATYRGITKGTSETTFHGNDFINETQFLTFVLRVLGYSDSDGDFTWDEAYIKATNLGIIKEYIPEKVFLRANMVDICFNSLTAKIKADDKMLYELLVENGVFTEQEFLKLTNNGNIAEICDIKDNKLGIFTVTIDDGKISEGKKMNDLLKKYSLKGTAYIPTGNLENGNISVVDWQQIFKEGYLDLGCHGYTHKRLSELDDNELVYETVTATQKLGKLFEDQPLITFATPYTGGIHNKKDIVDGYIFSNRSGGNRLASLAPSEKELLNLPSYIVKTETTPNELNLKADEAMAGCWLIEMWHGFDNAGSNYYPPYDVADAHFKYVSGNSDKLWFATMNEATRYIIEKKNARIDIYTDENMVFVGINDDLDDKLFFEPLTVKIKAPENASKADVKINEKNMQADIKNGYIFINLIPDSDKAVVTFY